MLHPESSMAPANGCLLWLPIGRPAPDDWPAAARLAYGRPVGPPPAPWHRPLARSWLGLGLRVLSDCYRAKRCKSISHLCCRRHGLQTSSLSLLFTFTVLFAVGSKKERKQKPKTICHSWRAFVAAN